MKLEYEKFIDKLQKNIKEQNLKVFKLEQEKKDLMQLIEEAKKKEELTAFIHESRENMKKAEKINKEKY
jgi:hypothetical protein